MAAHLHHIFQAAINLTPGAPIVIDDEHLALQFAIVERVGVKNLESEWAAAGVYMLIARLDSSAQRPATWEMYVGQARKLTDRLKQHVVGEKNWSFAILVRRKTTLGFNTAHINWLESHLCETWGGRLSVSLMNKTIPTGDEAIPPADYRLMEETLERIDMVLALRGISPIDPGSSQIDLEETDKPRRISKPRAVAVIIDGGLLDAGTELSLHPTNEVTADVRAQVKQWIEQDPRRGRTTWAPENFTKPLIWALDGEAYSPSTLSQIIVKSASGQDTSLQGTRWWFTEDGRDLTQIAGR